MVAGRATSARFDASDPIGPWMVTWIGASLANKGVGGAGGFAPAEAASAIPASNIHPRICPSSCSGRPCHSVWDHVVADDFKPAQRPAVIARIAGIDARQTAVARDLDAFE